MKALRGLVHQLQELCRVSLDATCLSSLYAKVDVAGGISEAFITLENVCICKYSDRVDLCEIPGRLPRCAAITSRVVVPVPFAAVSLCRCLLVLSRAVSMLWLHCSSLQYRHLSLSEGAGTASLRHVPGPWIQQSISVEGRTEVWEECGRGA